jgi:hypothetical protein
MTSHGTDSTMSAPTAAYTSFQSMTTVTTTPQHHFSPGKVTVNSADRTHPVTPELPESPTFHIKANRHLRRQRRMTPIQPLTQSKDTLLSNSSRRKSSQFNFANLTLCSTESSPTPAVADPVTVQIAPRAGTRPVNSECAFCPSLINVI